MVAQTMVRQLNAAREHVNLVGTLTHEAPETFDGVGGSNIPVHSLWKLVKGESLVFFLAQTPHRLGIALV